MRQDLPKYNILIRIQFLTELMWYESLLRSGFIPEPLLRWHIRRRLQGRINADPRGEQRKVYQQSLLNQLMDSPIAIKTKKANEQHYEVPAEFFQIILGKYLKYSACYWENENNDNLDQAEVAMLEQTIEHGDISDGLEILDLGCGWGSFTIYAAKKFPKSNFTALSNSSTQRRFIEKRVRELGLLNVNVITANIGEYTTDSKFDRIVSVEMFEHMRNYHGLFDKLRGLLNPEGKLLVHVFARRGISYLFDSDSPSDFMARYFFAGGIMPNVNLIPKFAQGFLLEQEWTYNGKHYQKTLESWLQRMKENERQMIPVLRMTYGESQVRKWWNYWKIFFIACAELFGYADGDEWLVKHYRFVLD